MREKEGGCQVGGCLFYARGASGPCGIGVCAGRGLS